MVAEKRREIENEIDWLVIAIDSLDWLPRAAKKLKVSQQTIRNWFEFGLGTIEFKHVIRLSHLSAVSMELLAKRLGPFKPKRSISCDLAAVDSFGSAVGVDD
jgi:hypothetical protein